MLTSNQSPRKDKIMEATCAEHAMSWQLTKQICVNYETVKNLLYHVNVIS